MGIAICLGAGLPAAGVAQNVSYAFTWKGEGGFEMRGALSFDADLLGADVVRENDVECFYIEGTRHTVPVGRWALGMRTEETDFILKFRPSDEAFVVWSESEPMPQAWNMDGVGTSCGTGGFGFNIGGQAQDLCIDGKLIWPSQVPPPRPFPAQREQVEFPSDACPAPALMSWLDLRRPEAAAASR